MTNLPRVATGSSYGAIARDDHARIAVEKALSRMRPCTVGSVLLFLTGAYAFEPQNAIKAAAKAAGTPLVFGCCAMSLLTEEEWLLDVEGAVAMVFPQEFGLQALKVLDQQNISPKLVMTLATPNAATIATNSTNAPQFGAIATDEYGHGPFSVWQSGRLIEQEFSQSVFSTNLKPTLVMAEGIKTRSPIMQINRSSSHDLQEIDLQFASDNLLDHIADNGDISNNNDDFFGLLCAVSEHPDRESIEQGHYKLHHVINIDRDKKIVRLSGSAKAGRSMFWATRDPVVAEQKLLDQLSKAKESLNASPEFAIMFPNISRGAEFFGGIDKDLSIFQTVFPSTPVIGFYGNGEISPGYQLAGLIRHYSTVIALYHT